ncbi:MAG: sigma-70 family RNA polymerase sigma factor [Saprospiraceae bacterium]|nr:sigma-70 family RNA polymerase sigma factor [Saprospiraceae bacterium]
MPIKQEELKQLIQDCRKGKRSAQKQLYQYYYSYGLTVALHYAKNREEAEEMLHDGFLKVFDRIQQFRFEAPFRSWFRQIIIRSAIDYFRKHHKAGKEARLIPLPTVNKTENEAIRRLSREDAWTLLQVLPPAYRMVFNLHVMEGYTHAEIAEELGVSIGTSKSNLSKAKQKLQQLMGPFFEIGHKKAKA